MVNYNNLMCSKTICDIIDSCGVNKSQAIGKAVEIVIHYGRIYGKNGTLNTQGVEKVLKSIFTNAKEKNINMFYRDYIEDIVDDYLEKKGILEQIENDHDFCLKEVESLISHVLSNKFIYHGTNSNNIPQIINTKNLIPFNSETVETLRNILNKYEHSNYSFKQYHSTKNKVFYSEHPRFSYGYGQSSPEWFAYLCDSGQHSYINRDYKTSKENIDERAARYNFSEEDHEKILSMFQEAWEIHADGKPAIIIIPDTSSPEEHHENLSNLKDLYFGKYKGKELFVNTLYNIFNFCNRVDCFTDQNIDISNAIIMEVPNYAEIEFKRQHGIDINESNIPNNIDEFKL